MEHGKEEKRPGSDSEAARESQASAKTQKYR
jgi:hypothetical protein